MEEYGIVVQKKERTAVIKAERTTSCDNCASKKSCHSGVGTDNEILIEAEDLPGTKVGDRVAFSVSAGSVLKAGMLLYLLPIAFFIGGVVLGQTVLASMLPGYNSDLVAGVTGVIFLALAFLGLKGYGALSERKGSLRPRILRVE
ncbi:MAG: SoxR reducing system RseC family protein [Deltaproteobacteria bacterium]|nr:SoxR reducing system RseC family protein [Deltaproteobacteria bacterium]